MNLEVSERWNKVRQLGLCFICLKPSHRASKCLSQIRCGETGCHGRHNKLLHQQKEDIPLTTDKSHIVCSLSRFFSKPVRLGTIPVKVVTKYGLIETLAFLDSGANTSLIKHNFIEKYELEGSLSTLNITTLGGNKSSVCKKLPLLLVSVDGKESVMIDEAYSINDLPVQPMKNINQMAKEWEHLRDINFVEPQGEEVTILLGCDVPEAHWVFDQRISGREQPYAIRTLFGWVLCGHLKDRYNTQTSINLFCCDDQSLSNQIKLMYYHEFGDTLDMSEAYSIQEKKELSIISEGTSDNNGHFVIPLPWKNCSTVIPVNLSLAHKRLNYLRGRFLRDGNLFDK